MIHGLKCEEHGVIEVWTDEVQRTATMATCPRQTVSEWKVPAWSRCGKPLQHIVSEGSQTVTR
jgi:hypothetical protein